MGGGVKACPADLNGYVPMISLDKTYNDGGHFIYIPSDESVKVLREDIRSQVCKAENTFYITTQGQERADALIKGAPKSIFSSTAENPVSIPDKIWQKSPWNITPAQIEFYVKNEPKQIEGMGDYSTDEWTIYSTDSDETAIRLSPRVVAQIRAILGDKESDFFKIFQRHAESNTYLVKLDKEKLAKVYHILRTMADELEQEGECDKETVTNIRKMADKFELIIDDIPNGGWGLEDILALILVTGILTFGVASPMGHDIYKAVKTWIKNKGICRAVKNLIKKKFNGDDSKKPPTDGPSGGAPSKDGVPEPKPKGEQEGQQEFHLTPAEKFFYGYWESLGMENLYIETVKMNRQKQIDDLMLAFKYTHIAHALDTGGRVSRDEWLAFENFLNGWAKKTPFISDETRDEWVGKFTYEAGVEAMDVKVLCRPENMDDLANSISPTSLIGVAGAAILGLEFAAPYVAPLLPELAPTMGKAAAAGAL